ncbi:MAG: PCP reductase family protein [Mariprofundaceae bacterium]
MTEEQPLHWSEEALELLEKIPDEVRPMARQMMELYARQQGIDSITEELMKDVRANFESQYGEQKKCPFTGEES